MAEQGPVWYIGHHESKRAHPVSEQTIREALDAKVSALGQGMSSGSFFDTSASTT